MVDLPHDIIRVFPRKAGWVPDDGMAYVGAPLLFREPAREVHVSCTFSWDMNECERLAREWRQFYSNVKIGGPAYDTRPDDFVPGMYLKHGYTITSRGYHHRCAFCKVHEREGPLRELPIKDGWIVEDSNLLACSRRHIEAVLEMLSKQPEPARFTGGFENQLVTPWLCKALKEQIRTRVVYLAYDRQAQAKSLSRAAAMLLEHGIPRGAIRCYCLVGFGDDTVEEAEKRMRWAFTQGVTPFAMYYRPVETRQWRVPPGDWKDLVQNWIWDKVIFARMAKLGIETKK